MPALPANLRAALSHAQNTIRSLPNRFDQRWLMPRYNAVVAVAYTRAEAAAKKSGAYVEDEFYKVLDSKAAQKAVKMIDTAGQKRGWAPGLLGLTPVASGTTTSTPAPEPVDDTDSMGTTSLYTQIGGVLHKMDPSSGEWIPVSGVSDADAVVTSDSVVTTGLEEETVSHGGDDVTVEGNAPALPRWLVPAAVAAGLAYVVTR